MQFVFQPLTWGFLLVLVPLLIHLINLLRHRRQKWAAMEFLLESYRKHRRWVWMKQLLLLLSRMAIMAVLVAMLAQWVSGSKWLSIFGQSTTHHYILLDDSLSMNDSFEGVTAYEQALRAIASLLRSAGEDSGSHQVSLLRYSRCQPNIDTANNLEATPSESRSNGNSTTNPINVADANSVADLLSRTVSSNSDALLERLNITRPVALDVDPTPALQTILPMIRDARGETAVVYLVSDFRSKDWRSSQSIREALEPIQNQNATIELIDCVPNQRENLTVSRLAPEQEVLAAGVPLMVSFEITNHGTAVQRNVNVAISTFEFDPEKNTPAPERELSGTETQLPPMVIDAIPPGESVSRRFQAIFSKAGSHAISVRMGDDALIDDNVRWEVVRITEGQELLLIDGEDSRQGSFFLNATVNPGGSTRTGWKTRVEGPAFLRDTDPQRLKSFAAIVMMQVRSLDPRAIRNLEDYVAAGGGLGIMLGGSLSDADYQRYNRDLYNAGKGLLPHPIVGSQAMTRNANTAGSPDFTPNPHPIFAPLLGGSGSPFQFVRISRFVELNLEQGPAPDGKGLAPQTIARLRDNQPLLLEYPFGDGRVMVMTTTLNPDWTNWPQDPTFVVVILKWIGYLASFQNTIQSALVGTPIQWEYSSRDFSPQVNVILASGNRKRKSPRVPLEVVGQPAADSMLVARVSNEVEIMSEEQNQAILQPGVIEFWGTTLAGTPYVSNVARNVPAREGELAKIESNDLIERLRPVEVKYRSVESLVASTALAGLANRQGFLLGLLILLLLVEQFLAWSASFHLPRTASAFSALSTK